jgi:PTS system glucitol/sorbitol-specific IIC component
MEWIQWFGEHFIGMFNEGGKTFMGLFTGIIPTLVVLLTFTYALMKFIGEERVTRVIQFASKYTLLRYTLMPILSLLLLTNPMAYTFGRFLPEKQKPAFYDSAVSFVHPVTGLFPYANAGELFVYLGIANGIKELGLPIADLGLLYRSYVFRAE